MKILSVVGARPQIIKAAALSRAIRNCFSDKLEDVILHTGQHYDQNMSDVFFGQMEIPQPRYNLGIGSGLHGEQTASMMSGIEEVLIKEKPGCLVVYGDTNSTLAASVAAAKLHVPVAHVEAGLRSFNKKMPEEINRIVCDHCSTLLFSPTQKGIDNLVREGFSVNAKPPFSPDNPGIFHTGDVMYDNSLYFAGIAEKQSTILTDHDLEEERFVLVTIHRDFNTDVPENFNSIFSSIVKIAKSYPCKLIIPLHPRTSKLLKSNLDSALFRSLTDSGKIVITAPVSFIDMIMLEKYFSLVMTDSGGVQKEAFFFKKPCIIMRPETEWVELVENGNSELVSADAQKIMTSFKRYTDKKEVLDYPPIYGDGHAAETICGIILKFS